VKVESVPNRRISRNVILLSVVSFLNDLSSEKIILFALYGAFYAAVDATQRAYVADLAQGNLRATALGTLQTVTGLAALPGGLLAGYLWEQVSPRATFLFGTVTGLPAARLFIASAARRRR